MNDVAIQTDRPADGTEKFLSSAIVSALVVLLIAAGIWGRLQLRPQERVIVALTPELYRTTDFGWPAIYHTRIEMDQYDPAARAVVRRQEDRWFRIPLAIDLVLGLILLASAGWVTAQRLVPSLRRFDLLLLQAGALAGCGVAVWALGPFLAEAVFSRLDGVQGIRRSAPITALLPFWLEVVFYPIRACVVYMIFIGVMMILARWIGDDRRRRFS